MNNEKDKIINLDETKKTKEIYDLGGLLPQIFSLFAKDLKPKLITCFELLDDTLFDLAEKADSNQNQTLYFESMRNIRKKRSQMFSDFFNSIKTTFKQFKNNNLDYFDQDIGYNPDVKSLSLSLVDEKELDETLAKTNLINKSDMAYHRQLFAFEKRFSVLASGISLKPSQIPISPHVLVNSFSKSIGKLDLDMTLKLIMYKLFERSIMGQLNSIYIHLNDFLANKGIVPDITYNIGQQGATSPSTSIQSNSEGAQTQQNNQNNQNTDQYSETKNNNQNNFVAPNYRSTSGVNIDPNYQLISQLFSHSHQSLPRNDAGLNDQNVGSYNNTNTGVNVPNVDIGSMINALNSLQSNLFKNNHSYNKSPTEIKDELIKQLNQSSDSDQQQKVKQKDEDTIDLVGMLFQFIVEDRNLPDAIQVILAKFQIPYLKIALKDRNLFADKNHPARELLDKLSSASIGWSEESDKNSVFIKNLEKLSHEVLELDDYNVNFYIEKLEQFEKFLSKQKRKSDVAQKRSKEKALGQDKINNAKEVTAQLLIDKMSDKEMPYFVRDLILGEWANVLILMHLRHGSDSKEYKQKVKFVDLILNHSQTNPDNDVSIDMIKEVTNLYGKGLEVVAFNPKETIDKQHQLMDCLYSVHGINIEKSEDKEIEMISPKEVLDLSEIRKQHEIVGYIEDIIEPSDEETTEKLEEKFLKIVDSLKIGTWLEFKKDQDQKIRAKLSWISPITSKYLFVNSRGLKITDKSNFDLASGLKNKTVRILQQVALFDRALSSIANKLKDTENQSTKGDTNKNMTNNKSVKNSGEEKK